MTGAFADGSPTAVIDFKGRFLTGDGRYCYPLTLRDAFSRFVVRCDALLGGTSAATRQRLERAFAEYGLPERIRSDNGVRFASPGLGRLSPLSVWWMRLGIAPERIAPGRPDQNGAHEQFHAVLKAETTRPAAGDVRAQQRRYVRFRREYNYERPHAALANDVAVILPAFAAIAADTAAAAGIPRAFRSPSRLVHRPGLVAGCAAVAVPRGGRSGRGV